MPQPIGHAPPDAAYLGIKPILMQPPKAFKGAHDDIEHFVGDCITYFKVFSFYFLLDSQTVPFTTSYFEGPAKEWWVYKRPEFWANNDNNTVAARFRYPIWPEFVAMLTAQFRDPAVEIFFYELEKEAKLAGRCSDEGEQGTLIAAVRRGLPESYTSMIANIRRDIPQTYSEWKARILVMYDERQKNYAFDQHLNHCNNRQPYKGAAPTATSNTKAGGTTSLSSGKPMSSTVPSGGHDTGGRWLAHLGTTFGGAGTPMDIRQMRAQGLCFRCHKKGHLSKDCLEKKDFRDIRQGGGKSSGGLGSDSPMIAKDLYTGARSFPAGQSYSTFLVTSCLNTHSNIPAPNFTAFNVPRTTSIPVPESQNRYAALSVDKCNNDDNDTDIPLKGSNNRSPARAEAKAVKPTGHEAESLSTLCNRGANRYMSSLHGETQLTKVSGKKSPTIVTPIDTASQPHRMDGTWAKLKYTPCEVPSTDEQAALT
ncbi:uncharacterized protein ARMOST_22397 [Armillaria ostoyae]|uniref:CCHC-type domain-containing protein n=1 Tax=Armillaria ostoyae TaxID=47428 RepID=A0A284SCT3_ARMOS|nr:uncharacterized protein ARMOST_22397 [Armillaria ostoyae]